MITCIVASTFLYAQTAIINGNEYAFKYSVNPNVGLYFNSNDVQFEFRDGAANPILSCSPATGATYVGGNMTVDGNIHTNGALQVDGNSYAFQLANNGNYGLYFNANSGAYQFRDATGFATIDLTANTGHAMFSGGITIGNTNTGNPGTLKWDGSNLLVRSLTGWQSLTGSQLPAGILGNMLHYDGADWVADNSIFNDGLNIGIGTVAPSSRLHVESSSQGGPVAHFVTDNANGPGSAVLGEGELDASGLLGVQGSLNFQSTGLDLTGDEIGVFGLSNGTTSTDNIGVYGYSNGWAGRFEHTSGNLVDLGGSSAIRIVDGTEGAGKVLTSDAGGNATWQLPAGGGGGGSWLGSGTGTMLAADVSDSVGIGNILPTAKLHVKSVAGKTAVRFDNHYDGGLTKYGLYNNVDGSGTGVRYGTYQVVQANINDNSASYGDYILMNSSGTPGDVYGFATTIVPSGTGDHFGVWSNTFGENAYAVYATNTHPDGFAGYFNGKAYFNSTVGIGVTDPTEAFEIDGNMAFATEQSSIMFPATSSANTPMIYMFDGGTTNSDRMVLAHSPAYDNWGLMYDDSTDDFHWVSGGTTKMRLDLGGGHLAINTDDFALGYKLSVNGRIMCEELRVQDIGDWPDYVFAEDYDLMAIEELAADIAKNHRLPGIPSADEVKENGVAVGEMQKMMMEKIEELTLYVIELKSENSTLANRVADLECQ